MISKLCNIFSFGHSKCIQQITTLMANGVKDGLKIKSLNGAIVSLLNQNQELKAIHDFAARTLESRIAELEDKLKSYETPATSSVIEPVQPQEESK